VLKGCWGTDKSHDIKKILVVDDSPTERHVLKAC
jgi:hypothetical protein